MCAPFQLANIAFFFEIPRIRFTICQIPSRPVESQPRGASISLSTQKAHGIVGLRPSECKENGFPVGPWGPGPPGSTSHVYIPYRREVIQGVKLRSARNESAGCAISVQPAASAAGIADMSTPFCEASCGACAPRHRVSLGWQEAQNGTSDADLILLPKKL